MEDPIIQSSRSVEAAPGYHMYIQSPSKICAARHITSHHLRAAAALGNNTSAISSRMTKAR